MRELEQKFADFRLAHHDKFDDRKAGVYDAALNAMIDDEYQDEFESARFRVWEAIWTSRKREQRPQALAPEDVRDLISKTNPANPAHVSHFIGIMEGSDMPTILLGTVVEEDVQTVYALCPGSAYLAPHWKAEKRDVNLLDPLILGLSFDLVVDE
jgi:hypothetical protein